MRLLPQLQRVLNRAVALDPQFAPHLDALDGKLLQLHLAVVERDIFIEIVSRELQLSAKGGRAPDLRLSGSPLALLRMACAEEPQLAVQDVQVQGDVALAQQVQRILQRLDIDWEEQLAKLTGDTLAQRLGGLARHSVHWFTATRQQLRADVTDYLQEEARYLPTRAELDAWYVAVDELRDGSERLAARWQQLQAGYIPLSLQDTNFDG